MSERILRVGMAQMLVEGGQPEANLRRAVAMIHDAATRGAAVVVLPECLDLGWTHPSARRLAQPIPGPHSDRLADAAIDAGVFVAAGLVERDGGRLYNAAVLISPEGQILLKHRKINELSIAFDLYETGSSLAVVETPIGRIGVDICADNFSNSLALGHALGRMGAQVLLSPSAWAVPPDHNNQKDPYGGLWIASYTELARLYEMPVIGVSNVGPMDAGVWAGMKCIGASIAVGHDGSLVRQLPYGERAEALEVVEVTLVERSLKGTSLCEALAARGYHGP
jgi:predicted amidohydrolase